MFREEGRIAFDLFAPNATRLLATSSHLLSSLARRHPIIIVDEAQDTGQFAWQCVEMLAPHAQIVCPLTSNNKSSITCLALDQSGSQRFALHFIHSKSIWALRTIAAQILKY